VYALPLLSPFKEVTSRCLCSAVPRVRWLLTNHLPLSPSSSLSRLVDSPFMAKSKRQIRRARQAARNAATRANEEPVQASEYTNNDVELESNSHFPLPEPTPFTRVTSERCRGLDGLERALAALTPRCSPPPDLEPLDDGQDDGIIEDRAVSMKYDPFPLWIPQSTPFCTTTNPRQCL
jgi:hypothetical protein